MNALSEHNALLSPTLQHYFAPAKSESTSVSPALLLSACQRNTERPRTLLIVDDEENILAALRRLFRRDGYLILTASSGQEALALLKQHPVDLVLSDQRMPGMSGVEFLRQVKTDHPQSTRLVLSGYADLASVTQAVNEGDIYKFLTKPWDDEDLRQHIAEAFRHKELADSERARMESLLGQIVDGDPVATLVINARHEVTHWNRACAALTGVSAADMIGTTRQWSAFYQSERPLLADLILSGKLAGLNTHYDGKFRRSTLIEDAYEVEDFFPHFGQGGRWLYFTAAPIRDPEGHIIGAIETLQDVTARHQAEENLRLYQTHLEELVEQRTQALAQANRHLLQAEKLASIGQLAAGVAHEINNPIGYVHSNLGTLENYLSDLLTIVRAYQAAEEKLPAQEAKRMASLREQADLPFLTEDIPVLLQESREGITRVKKIVQDLKDFSRVDTQEEWKLADLHQGIDSTINIAANEIKYKADVIREYGDLPDIECLPHQLNQVFMNLLVNAAQAMGETRGSITIRTGASDAQVWLEFSDTGRGIEPEHLARIFDPFFTTKPVGMGTGLGLSLAYSMIENHHGKIMVSSELGRGTTFRITLPIHQPHHAAAPQVADLAIAASKESS